MEPNAPKDPLDPTPSPLPSSSEIPPPPPPPPPPSEPFVPPAPPTIDPTPLSGSGMPSSFDLPPGATPPPPVSNYTGSDMRPPPPPVSSLAGGDVPPVMPAVPSTKDERLWATLIHLGGIVGLSLAHFMIPGNILIPLVMWLIKREGNPFVDQQGKEALNFQISVTIAWIVALLLVPVFCIGVVLMFVIAATALVLGIIAAIKANEGVAYRYPFCLRLIK